MNHAFSIARAKVIDCLSSNGHETLNLRASSMRSRKIFLKMKKRSTMTTSLKRPASSAPKRGLLGTGLNALQ